METWILYVMNQYGSPKIKPVEVQDFDIKSAIANFPNPDAVICVKLKTVTEAVVGL